jgi:hypothetical protein
VKGADIDKEFTTTTDTPEWITVFEGGAKADEPVYGLKEMLRGFLWEPHTRIPVLAEVLQEFRASVQNVPEFCDRNRVTPAK